MRQEDLHRYIANEGKASHNRQSHQVRVLTLHANGIENGNDRKRPKQTHYAFRSKCGQFLTLRVE